MARIIKFSRNYWSKLGLATIPVLYGINLIKHEYQIHHHLKDICNNVVQYSPSKATNILVILNPVANKKSSEKMFEKYCEPVLHMAGYYVEVIKTNHIGHAKSVMESIHRLPDIVVVAGGDGTSSEVVTGLLRRNTEVCPILFLPLGERNKTVFGFVPKQYKGKTEFVKYLSNFLLALIHERVQCCSVVKYEIIKNDKQQQEHKPIFGLQGFSWGVLSDIENKKDKYWYFGGFKYYASVIISFLRNKIDENLLAKLVCTPPCPGCDKCVIPLKSKIRHNFSNFLKLEQNVQTIKHVSFDNKLCGTKTFCDIKAKQIDITCNRNMDSLLQLNINVIENMSDRYMLLINMLKKIEIQPTVLYKGHTIEVFPLQFEPQIYYIDGESYDARPIKISILPNAIKYFC